MARESLWVTFRVSISRATVRLTHALAILLQILLPTPRQAENDRAGTFVIGNEDHTLGNSLRYAIMKDPRVEFCGYDPNA